MNGVAVVDVTARQGSEFEQALSWFTAGPDYPGDPDDKVPHDFTGATAAMHVRLDPRRDVVLNLTTANGGLIIDGGTITITATSAQMAEVAAGRYGYDLELTQNAGTSALAAGRFTIEPEYTR